MECVFLCKINCAQIEEWKQFKTVSFEKNKSGYFNSKRRQ